MTLADGDANLRVLVGSQTNATQNGLWDAKAGAWTRCKDFDASDDFVKGSRIFVNEGTTQWGMWILTSSDPMVIDQSSLVFEAFSAVDVNVASLDVAALTENTLVNDETDFDFIYTTALGYNQKYKTKNLGFTQSGTGAVLRSLQSKLRNTVHFADFAPVRDGASDDSVKFQQALTAAAGGTLYIERGGNFVIAQAVAVPASTTVINLGTAYIVKGANCDMMTMADSSRLIYVNMAGNGASYTGKGIVITAGSDQHLDHCTITDMNGYCVDVGNDIGARMEILGGTYYRTTATNPAIRFANGGVLESVGERKMIGVQSGGSWLLDNGGSQNTHMTDCSMINMVFNPLALKTSITNCRFASLGLDVTVHGNDHTLTGCIFAGNLVLAADSGDCTVTGEVMVGSLTDSGTNNHYIRVTGGLGTAGQMLTSNGAPNAASFQGIGVGLDTVGSTRGSLLYRGAANWAARAPGTLSYPLVSAGSGADPDYNQLTIAGMQFAATQRLFGRNTAGAGTAEEVTATQAIDWIGSTRGSVLYRGASGWAARTPGTVNLPLVSAGAGADPDYNLLSVAGGGSGRASTTVYAVICGGTTTTGAEQSIASVGTAGQTLVSNGAGALPSMQDASALAGGATLTKADDTNVTLTLGGTPTGALLKAASITAGWTGTLSIARGGTAAATAAAARDSLAVVGKVVYQTFVASGTYTPNSKMLYCIIECLGGGGAGGGVAGAVSNTLYAAGGGAGSYARAIKTAAQIGASQTVTIGAAGVGVSGANAGGNGGDTSVGSLCIGKGGSGGNFTSTGQAGAAGAGGVAGTGDFTSTGGSGGGCFYYGSSTLLVLINPGSGANSIWGGGGVQSCAAGVAGAGGQAQLYGAGGAGATAQNVAANAAGGNGAIGIVIITEFCSQ